MRNLKDIILERLVLSKNTYKLFPKSKEELQKMIEDEIEKNGNRCSLNHIDVSQITDMSKLFMNSEFNGDISKWDVLNVEDMSTMFCKSKFTGENGDISSWNVSNVTNMSWMFAHSKFNGDISKWDVSNVTDMRSMFLCVWTDISDISKWKVNPNADFTEMFANSHIDQDLSNWKINKTNRKTDKMFWNTEMFLDKQRTPQLV